MTYENDYLHSKYNAGTPHNKKTTRVQTITVNHIIKQPNYALRKWGLGSFVALILFLFLFWQPISDSSAVIFSSTSSDIKQAGRDAGLNMHGQAIFLNNDPEFVDASALASACPHDEEVVEYGCYLPTSRKIYILKINNSELKAIMLTSVAHETLHAVWNDMSYDDSQKVDDELTTFYKSNTSETLTTDAKPYQKEDPTTFVDELHSLAGSEVGLSILPSFLQSHFSKYFSDQNKTVQSNISFNQNIENQTASIKFQKEQLDADSKELDNFQAAHLDNIERVMQQNLYYGDTYTYNENVDAYNHNREIYNDMVNKYNTSVNTYNSVRQNFVDAYSALFPGKTVPVPDAK